ncbi:Hypothetical protein R9X50_00267500 [Acrodontium crateriforme]|uniref:Cyclin N-terminal domain-containing protein n=1 Tax=Acrodontium crateriforme TaxID=150365 RepID=A0AAQ3R3N4_9PEZI|nr:Hypothetical protein R9X50_00267500 [Acrodontium crateriforme]
MDAKPQRPRALRIHDENMPPAAVSNILPGKTLHHRNKSTPALSSLLQVGAIKAANKKVLGEVNANTRAAQLAKDDSEIGKVSPGKYMAAEPMKLAAAAIRPTTRALAPKTISSQNAPAIIKPTALASLKHRASEQALPSAELVRKVIPKKSTKVLRETQLDDGVKPVTSAPVHAVKKPLDMLSDFDGVPVQHQEIRKTESIPLRDEPVTRLQQVKQAVTGSNSIHQVVSNLISQPEPVTLLEHTTSQLQLQQNIIDGLASNQQYFPSMQQQPVEQFYDVDEDEYYADDGYTTARSFGLRGDSTGGVTTILAPKQNEKIAQELAAAMAFVEATRSPEDVEDEMWDTSMVAEYGDEIFSYMRDLETRMAPNPRYMDQQQEIQWSMRAVLMDWVIQVHGRFNLLPETLFLTVNYIDRFLSCKIVSLGKLQLVGATAIFVAAKYEEVQCPTIAEIIYMVDGGYTAEELLKAERFMLSMLQFELGWPGPMSFLRRISKADDYDLETRTLAKYFLEITVMDERFVGCTPSFLAAGAHCMARLMLRKGDWTPAHTYYSNYTYGQLRQLLAAILECCEEPKKHHNAVYEKYTDKRYKRASTFVEAEMQKGFQLPAFSRGSSFGIIDSVPSKPW